MLGPSGSGKSTLALAIAGLVPREVPGDWSGTLEVDGEDTRRAPASDLAARVGIVFQDPSSQLVMERVEDDVAFGLENRGWTREEMRARVPAVLSELGIEDLARARTTRVSGGQQQRVALAGVVAARPKVLVLDEPTANLDPAGADAFLRQLALIRERREATVVLVEHRVELAWELADSLLVLGSDGRPMAFGDPNAVLAAAGRRLPEAGVWLPDEIEAPLARRRGSPRTITASGAPGAPTMASGPRAGPAAPPGLPPHPPVPGRMRARAVSAVDVTYEYESGSPVVSGVYLEVAEGERIVLVGRNGSGKSTLARLLVGLLKPRKGAVNLGGAAPHRLPAERLARHAAYVFQNPEQQFLAGTVTEEVMLGLHEEERAAAASLMEDLELPLDRFGPRSPYELSGGEQRRLSLATALVRRPRLLVLDEPTFGQDRRGYAALLGILASRVEAGCAVIVATQDLRLIRDLGSRVVGMQEGRVVHDGPLSELVQDQSKLTALGLGGPKVAAALGALP